MYLGPWCDDFYVTNLVPRDALEKEAGEIDPETGIGGFEVVVEFKLQVKGCDFPSYELSQFSEPVRVVIKATSTVASSDASSNKSTVSKSKSKSQESKSLGDDAASEISDFDADDKETYQSSFMKSSITSKPFSHITAETEEDAQDKKLVSKVRESVFNVVLNDTTVIQLHQIRDSTYSYGVGDEYI